MLRRFAKRFAQTIAREFDHPAYFQSRVPELLAMGLSNVEAFRMAQMEATTFRRRTAVVIGVTGLASMVYFTLNDNTFLQTTELRGTAAVLAAALTALTGLATSLLVYLNSSSQRDRYIAQRDLQRVADQVLAHAQMQAVANTTEHLIAEDDKSAILQRVEQRLSAELSNDFIKTLEKRFAETVLRAKYSEKLELLIAGSRDRLGLELASLERRGNLNLVIGIVTTLIGFGTLAAAVFTAPQNGAPSAIAAHFVPRIALVTCVQVLGFFFLKLYRNSLDGIKYFHNELTNLESRFAALAAAQNCGSEKMIASVVSSLVKVERNSVLQKGQTTVELERAKREGDSLVNVTESFGRLLDVALKSNRSSRQPKKRAAPDAVEDAS